jgi:hypothetical protein
VDQLNLEDPEDQLYLVDRPVQAVRVTLVDQTGHLEIHQLGLAVRVDLVGQEVHQARYFLVGQYFLAGRWLQ